MTPTKICDEITADATSLMALLPDAPERVRAEIHARTCPACAMALAEGRRLLAMIEAAPLPAPSAEALRRASAAILSELMATSPAGPATASASRAPSGGRLAAAVAAAVMAVWALPLALSRRPLSTGRDLAVSAGLAALAAVTSATTVTLGGLAAAAFPVLSAVAALLAGTGRALAAGPGLHCALIETLTAVGAGAAAYGAARLLGRRAQGTTLLVAAAGGGALAGHAALHEICAAATELPHLLVFHTGPVALLVGLALALTAAARRAAEVRESFHP
jgi:hypothetical protein